MRYRFWCGECGFKTPWAGQPEGRLELVRHCERRHAGHAPSGHIEAGRWWGGGRVGCLMASGAGLLVLLLVVVALWRSPA
ncbi:hypothetical protein ACWC9T_38680 [Kitasatospora sp. NPDC001159]